MGAKELREIQPTVINILLNSYLKERLSHAYLFVGEKGTKKLDTASFFARMLYCKETGILPCDECHNCKRIFNGTHPNVYLISPSNGVIKKEQITSLISEFAKSSVEEGPKIYIINEADKMNTASANSLLKILEEPTSESYAILITENLNLMLKTIVSRSQIVNFQSLNKEMLKKELIIQGFEDELVNILPEYTNSISEMQDIANDDDMYRIISLVRELFNLKFENQESMVMYFNEKYDLVKKNKDRISFFLTLILLYLKDILSYQSIHKEDFVFIKDRERIIELSKAISNKNVIILIEKVLEIKNRFKFNVNERLVLDELLFSLERSYI